LRLEELNQTLKGEIIIKMPPKLVRILELKISDVFKKIGMLPLGKSICVHDLNKLEVEQLKGRFDKEECLIGEKEDLYFPFFDNDSGTKKYMVLIDRISKENKNA